MFSTQNYSLKLFLFRSYIARKSRLQLVMIDCYIVAHRWICFICHRLNGEVPGRVPTLKIGFNPRPGQTKDFKNGTNGFPSLALVFEGLALWMTCWCHDKWTSS